MGSPFDQGRQLEERIAAFFGTHGYVTRCNAVLEGRSGGRHEIDVLAEKSDALTTYRVAVECKAWASAIEKDVVTKLHYVVGDLGLSKGIVVSLGGCRSGAEQAAAALGIELWGPDELRRHLGDAAVGALTIPPAPGRSAVWGIAPTIPATAAETTIRTAGKGRFNLRTLEQLAWLSLLWVPAYSVEITVTEPETRRLKTRLRSTTFSNLYEALSGVFLGRVHGAGWEQVPADRSAMLRPAVKDTKVHVALRKAVDGYLRVSTETALARHAAELARLGLPAPCRSVSVDRTGLVHLPYYAGLLQAGGRERIAAVSASTGQLSDPVSEALTANLSVVRAQLTAR